MALKLPGKDQPEKVDMSESLIGRSLSDLEDFCKHMRIYGQSGDIEILIVDRDGNSTSIIGFEVSLACIKIGKAL